MNTQFTILVVDDSVTELEMLKDILDRQNYLLILARSGKEALAFLDKIMPDLILMDLYMYGMNGFEVCARIKSKPLLASIPLIFLSGTTNREDKIQGFSLGAVDFISKPYQEEEIFARISTHLTLQQKIKDLDENQRQIKNILRIAPIGICVVFGNKIIRFNDKIAEILGYQLHEIENKNVSLLFENPTEFEDIKKQISIQNTKQEYETRWKQKNGNIIDVSLKFTVSEIDKFNYEIVITVQDITLKKKRINELKNYYEIINSSPTVLFVWQPNMPNPVKYATENAFRIFGYSNLDFMSGKILYQDVFVPEDLQRVSEEVEIATKNKNKTSVSHEPYRIIAKDGSIKWIKENTTIHRDSKGNVLYLQGVLTDITQQKEAEINLRRSKDKLNTILDTLQDAVVITSTDHKISYMNRAGKELFSGMPENNTCFNLVLGVALPCNWHANLLEKKISSKGYCETKRLKTGRYYLVSANKFTNDEGEVSYVSVYKDITELKEAEAEKGRFFEVLNSSLNEVFIVDLDNFKVNYANNGALRNLGFSFEELYNCTFWDIVEEFAPAKLSKVIGSFDTKKTEKKQVEMTFVRKNGTKYPAEVTFQVISEGKSKVLLVNVYDISERIENRNTIRKLTAGISQSPISVVITDLDGNIEFVNSHFINDTGYTLEDIKGLTPRVLKSGYHTAEFYEQLWQTISEGKTWRGEILNLNKNQELFWEECIISPVKNEEGKVTNYIALKTNINKRIQIERALSFANSLNTEILNITKVGYAFFSLSGDFISQNDVFKQISELLTNVHAAGQVPEPFWKQKKIATAIQRCIKMQKKIQIITHFTNLSGGKFWFSLSVSLINIEVGKQILLTIKDITRLASIEKELEISENQFKAITGIISHPVFSIGKTGTIMEWNIAMEAFTGYLKTEVRGKKYFELDIFENIDLLKDLKVLLKGKNGINITLHIRNKKGMETSVLFNTTSRSNSDGKLQEILCIGYDITEMNRYKNKLEQEVKLRTKELEVALAKEKEIGELKSKFVSMASHEFRTPLSAISFATGYLNRYWDKINFDMRTKKFDRIEAQIKHMTSMLDDVLLFGKGNADKLIASPKWYTFNEFFKPIFDEIYNMNQNKCKINLSGEKNCPNLYIDEKIGRNIFLNLLSNAIKFSPRKQIVDFSVQYKKGKCIFKIKDYGIGIAQNELNKIFNPFHRGTNVDTIQGTGLGLSIVKDNVKLMNGEISVESKLNNGTTFTVTLPNVKLDNSL